MSDCVILFYYIYFGVRLCRVGRALINFIWGSAYRVKTSLSTREMTLSSSCKTRHWFTRFHYSTIHNLFCTYGSVARARTGI
jgi:hypothetical protein